MLEPGDLEEALNAASAIGDDHCVNRRKAVVPDAFQPRYPGNARWFRQDSIKATWAPATPLRQRGCGCGCTDAQGRVVVSALTTIPIRVRDPRVNEYTIPIVPA